jgi:hypothetical protein
MNKRTVVAALSVVAAFSSVALADSTLSGHVLDIYHGLGSNNNGGYSHHFWNASDASTARFTGGAMTEGAAALVYAFCTDANYLNPTNPSTYYLVDVTDAPVHPGGNPGNPTHTYTPQNRTDVNATALAGLNSGILNSLGFLSSSFQSNLSSNVTISGFTFTKAAWIEGLQKEIWHNLGVDGVGLGGAGSAQAAIESLRTAYLSSPIVVRILGVDNGGNQGQDMLVIVPLPPAAWAGIGSLAGVMVVGLVRRRRQLS